MFLDYLALGFLIFGALVTFYLIIGIHDIPYEIAKERNHPHQDAIHVAGWVSLMTLHTIWPFLWIWATIYRPERGYGFAAESGQAKTLDTRIADLEARLAALEGKPPEETRPAPDAHLTALEGRKPAQEV